MSKSLAYLFLAPHSLDCLTDNRSTTLLILAGVANLNLSNCSTFTPYCLHIEYKASTPQVSGSTLLPTKFCAFSYTLLPRVFGEELILPTIVPIKPSNILS